jgi:hypothetical protein
LKAGGRRRQGKLADGGGFDARHRRAGGRGRTPPVGERREGRREGAGPQGELGSGKGVGPREAKLGRARKEEGGWAGGLNGRGERLRVFHFFYLSKLKPFKLFQNFQIIF